MHANSVPGPYFFHNTKVSVDYYQMLDIEVRSKVQLLPQNAVLLQDEAILHITRPACSFLDEMFQISDIGRCGPAVWPARLPDLYPPDFFL